MSTYLLEGDIKYDLLQESMPKCAFELVEDYILSETTDSYYAFETAIGFQC